MAAPVLIPSECWNNASEETQQKIRETCVALQTSPLASRSCKWHVVAQTDSQYPYILTAYDAQSGGSIRQFPLDNEGSNSFVGESPAMVTSPGSFASIQVAGDHAILSVSRQLAQHNIKLIKLDVLPSPLSSQPHNQNLCLDVFVDVIRGSKERVEQDVREAYLAASREGLGINMANANTYPDVDSTRLQVRLWQDKAPTPVSATAADDEPKVRSSSSRLLLNSNMRTSSSLQKKPSLSSLKGSGGATPPRSPVSRRASSILVPTRSASSPKVATVHPQEPPPPPMTPAAVARDYFLRDLMHHEEADVDAGLVVILHDSCYGHRFSRPKTSKASLSTIVERPERILAAVLGVSTAYVLLGGRHFGADFAPHPERNPSKVPFKIRKSSRFVPLISPTVTNVHGTTWMNELKMMCEGAEAKLTSTGNELVRPAVLPGDDTGSDKPTLHDGDLYLCEESLNALEGALGGVFDGVDAVFDISGPRRAFVGIRPPGHHCSADYPSGFCWLNNVHVGISHAAAVHGMTHAAIIDFDLHHGDGSQSITWAHNSRVASLPRNAPHSKRTAIGYFSLHDINSYPCEWGDIEKVQNASLCIEQAHGQSIWNVHLQPWKTDAEFWELYEKRYIVLLEKMRAFLRHHTDRLQKITSAPQPRAAIFISAGFDASEWEGHGMQRHKVNVPTDFYARFTRDIMNLANEPELGTNGRIISVLEGGYSDRALTSGVLSHLSGMADLVDASTEGSSFANEMTDRLGNMSLDEDVAVTTGHLGKRQLDPHAWSPHALEELESAINPAPLAAPKKPRGPMNPTYSTPTQSFTAKMHPTAKPSSGSFQDAPKFVSVPEVIPDVSWALAAHELSKILTPDRQTQSCNPGDLNAQATKVRRDRQSVAGFEVEALQTEEEGKGMQLRGRKAKAPPSENQRPASRSSRRTTIGGSEISDLLNFQTDAPPKAQRRRTSVASTIMSMTEDANESVLPAGRTRRASSISVRPPSATGRKTDAQGDKVHKPGSPLEPGTQKKAVPATAIEASSTTKVPGKAISNTQTEHGVNDITSGVQKMRIKLNLPPKREDEVREPKARPGRPRKAPMVPKAAQANKAPTTAKTGKKTNLGGPRQPSAASTASSSAPSELAASTATTTPLEALNIRPPAGGYMKTVPSSTVTPTLEHGGLKFATATPHSAKESDSMLQSSQQSGMHSPDGEDSTFEVRPFDAAKASGEAKQQGVMGGMDTVFLPEHASLPTSSQSAIKLETPRAIRQQLPTFTSTSPIPFAIPSKVLPSNGGADSDVKPESNGLGEQQTKARDIWAIPNTPQSSK